MASNRTVRCPSCLSVFTEEQIVDAEACPSCHTEAQPLFNDLDVTLTLNWDDLRLLANWATNWAEQEYKDTDPVAMVELRLILDKIRSSRPAEGEPLTLADAIQELANMGLHVNPDVQDEVAPYGADPVSKPEEDATDRRYLN